MTSKLQVKQLHVLRAVACIGVVLNHAKQSLWSGADAFLIHKPIAGWNILDYVSFGFTSIVSIEDQRVYFFFIMSGFFLRYSATKKFSIKQFFTQRFLRLWPAYFVATLVSGLVLYACIRAMNVEQLVQQDTKYTQILVELYANLTWSNLFTSLLFLNKTNFFGMSLPFWSMKHEVLFCLIFPLYHYAHKNMRLVVLLLLVVLTLLTESRLLHAQIFFLVGVIYHDLFAAGARLRYDLPKGIYYALFLSLYLTIFALTQIKEYFNQPLASVFTIVLAFISFEFFLYKDIKTPKLMTTISNMSYSIYLNHMWIMLVCFTVLSGITGTYTFYSQVPYMAAAVISVMCCSVFYRVVEKPMQAYLKRPAPSTATETPHYQPEPVFSATPEAVMS